MAIETMTMPQLGESVTEGTISKWLIKPGDFVNKYDPIAEVMTDKVNAEIPSSFTGTIKQLLAEEDETLAVGEAICSIEAEGAGKTEESGTDREEESEQKSPETAAQQPGQVARFSPAVLTLAAKHGIDLRTVAGSGAGGRITRKDILKMAEAGEIAAPNKMDNQQVAKANKPAESMPKPKQSSAQKVPALSAGDVEIPVNGVRKAIAANMVRAKQEIPHAWMMVEVDATKLVSYRDAEKVAFKEKEGYNLTYFAFFVKAVAQALKEFPQLNSTWAGDKIIQRKAINLSIAVAKDESLFVPVIKHADEKTIKGIAREITELAAKARTGKLKQEDMQGGTFTVNNTGSFGSVQSMGIINHPQAAILQIESIVKKPVIIDGMIAVRDMVNLCLSLDHRVLDGLVAGKFLTRVKDIIEHMSKDTISIY
ncbi:MAG: dihydrolipoamide acetyltransferase family protein [Bacillus sp. (in: firmicutes)]